MPASPYMVQAQENADRLPFKEAMLGKGLCQPFCDSNSGVRKLMFSVHIEQALPLVTPEVPFIMTGYEQQYSDRSSSIVRADKDYEVVDKICKFSDNPQHHYYLILRDVVTNKLSVMERVAWLFSGETYGYEYNNSILDDIEVGMEIPENSLLRTSTTHDEYLNPRQTVNLLGTYLTTTQTMEDSLLISESARQKLASKFYKKVVVNINDNDLLLNTMGDANTFKSFPMVGEKIQNGTLCAVRREVIEESLYTQSVDMLRTVLMSDDSYTPGDNGEVIHIDIHCNNPEVLREKFTNSQVLYLYNDHIRFITEFVESIDKLMDKYRITQKDLEGKLGIMYYNFKAELAGDQFMDQKVYSGTEIEFIIREVNLPSKGDKLANRFGGKGVIAGIIPDELMPRLSMTNEPLEILINSSSVVNRENPGQWHELSLTHIGKCILDLSKFGALDKDESFHEICKFLSMCSPQQGVAFADYLRQMDDWEKSTALMSMYESGNLIISIEPMTESMCLDMLADIYEAFPYITQRRILVPQKSSTGKVRFIPARRAGTVGHVAMYRLQQYAEEKHSVTSLSPINLRGENSRSKASKYYKSTHRATPINIGAMEAGNLGHMGFEHVITMLMIHSVSPHARRLVAEMFTGDPYMVNIELDDQSSNRSVEILNTYLKAIGYKLEFIKRRKKLVKPIMFKPFYRGNNKPMVRPFFRVDPNQTVDIKAYLAWLDECNEKIKRRPIMYKPFTYKID